jgi:hypothetical protein
VNGGNVFKEGVRSKGERGPKQFYDESMPTQIEVAELGARFKELVDELATNGGDACLTHEGNAVVTL